MKMPSPFRFYFVMSALGPAQGMEVIRWVLIVNGRSAYVLLTLDMFNSRRMILLFLRVPVGNPRAAHPARCCVLEYP